MKLDTKYSSINVCPETDSTLSDNDIYNKDGVCVHCGHSSSVTVHHTVIPGRWNRPTFFERVFRKKEFEFLRKSDEDAVWDGLKGDEQ